MPGTFKLRQPFLPSQLRVLSQRCLLACFLPFFFFKLKQQNFIHSSPSPHFINHRITTQIFCYYYCKFLKGIRVAEIPTKRLRYIRMQHGLLPKYVKHQPLCLRGCIIRSALPTLSLLCGKTPHLLHSTQINPGFKTIKPKFRLIPQMNLIQCL